MPQRSYTLQPHEQKIHQMYTGQRRDMLVRYAEIQLEMEELRKAVEANADRQRSLLSAIVTRSGAERYYRSARIEGEHLICDVEEELPAAKSPEPTQKVNGRQIDGDLVAVAE
jgi:hypothetical protein